MALPTDLQLMLQLLVQLVVLLGACTLFGAIGQKYLGQGRVTMEMVTGVLLGPSCLGILAPQLQERLFPLTVQVAGQTIRHPSMSILYCLAQLGLVLYMFVIGMEFDLSLAGAKARAAISVSLAGIFAPFVLTSIVFFVYLSGRTDLFTPKVSGPTQLAYLGAAMCITAFPMLARIIHEEGLSKTSLGVVALGAGALDDAFAWITLALVVAASKNDPQVALYAIAGSALYGIALFGPVRALVERHLPEELNLHRLVCVVAGLFLCAWFTDYVGIYAVFGAFTYGAMLKKGAFTQALRTQIEPITISLLLPCFFVYSGLNTKLSLISGVDGWTLCALLLLVAVAGKFGGCYVAARASGEDKHSASSIATLMNARGLMELIILDIGLKQGIISKRLYAMMAVMAIVTTLMAVPVYRRIRKGAQGEVPVAST